MKNLSKILAVLAMFIATACTKEGQQGPAGANGNANVTVYRFETDFVLSSSSTYIDFTLSGLSQNTVDSSLILGFFQESGCSNYWYNCPGLGCAAAYNSRSFTWFNSGNMFFTFLIHDADGTTYSGVNKTFTNFKVIVIPASSVVNGRKRDPRTMTYEEVCKAYNIKE